MKTPYAKADPNEIQQIEFDDTKLCSMPTDEDGEVGGPWLSVEPVSDEHIAILEQVIEGAQTRLAEIRRQREAPKQ